MFKKIVTLRYMRAALLILVLTISFIFPVLCLADNIESGVFDSPVKNVEKSFNLENTPSLVTKAWKKIGKIISRPQQKTAAALVGSKAAVRDVKDAQVIGQQNIYVSGGFANNNQNILSEKQTKPIIFNLPPRNSKFVGRGNALIKIKERLNEQKLGIMTQAISGAGGIGKTQLATEFACRAAENKEYSVVFWVPAETANSIDYAYREFAKFLQIDIRGLGYNEIQSFVHRELVERHKGSRILFILDNVPDYENIKSYIEGLNKDLLTDFTLHILITSRNQHWLTESLVLDTFTPQEALIFAKKHLPGEDESLLIKLIEALHCYPLALSQATAYIKQHTDVDNYLVIYSAKKQDYLDRFSGNKNQYPESLWKTWNIALAKLSDVAKEMLFISSYLYSDDIPVVFFDNLSIGKREDAVNELRKHSFIILSDDKKSFKVHRLLQEVIRTTIASFTKDIEVKASNDDVIKKKFNILIKAISLLRVKFNFNYIRFNDWNLCGKYLTHAQSLADHTINIKNHFLCAIGVRLYAKVAMYLTYGLEDNKNASKVWKKILTLVRKYYSKDKSFVLVIANINTHLGRVTRQIGDVNQAEKYLEKALLIYKKYKMLNVSVNTGKLLDCLRWDQDLMLYDGIRYDRGFALYNWGLLKQDLADFNAAENFYKKGFRKLNKCKGINFILYTKSALLLSLGNLYRYCGDIAKAKNTFANARAFLGKNLQQSSFAYEYAGSLQYYMGMYDEARESLENCWKNRLFMYSAGHLRIGCIRAILGLVLCASNRVEEAIANLKQAENIYNETFEKGHARYVFLYICMSYAYELNEEYDEALQYLRRAQEIALKCWGRRTRIALVHQLSPIEKLPSLRSPEKNRNYYTKALNIVKTLFGENHIRVARYHYLLGQIFKNVRNKFQARKHYQKALEIANKQHFDDEILIVGHQKNIKIIQEALDDL